MLNVREFKAAMVRKGYTQKELAKILGISEKTFGNRIKSGRFGSDEIERLIPLLEINNPMNIFFSSLVSFEVTKNDRKEN